MNSIPTSAMAALTDAAKIAGDIRVLARRLHVPTKQLTSWIDGDEPTPYSVMLRALDFVRGAHA
jgi:hypothetical protein